MKYEAQNQPPLQWLVLSSFGRKIWSGVAQTSLELTMCPCWLLVFLPLLSKCWVHDQSNNIANLRPVWPVWNSILVAITLVRLPWAPKEILSRPARVGMALNWALRQGDHHWQTSLILTNVVSKEQRGRTEETAEYLAWGLGVLCIVLSTLLLEYSPVRPGATIKTS